MWYPTEVQRLSFPPCFYKGSWLQSSCPDRAVNKQQIQCTQATALKGYYSNKESCTVAGGPRQKQGGKDNRCTSVGLPFTSSELKPGIYNTYYNFLPNSLLQKFCTLVTIPHNASEVLLHPYPGGSIRWPSSEHINCIEQEA